MFKLRIFFKIACIFRVFFADILWTERITKASNLKHSQECTGPFMLLRFFIIFSLQADLKLTKVVPLSVYVASFSRQLVLSEVLEYFLNTISTIAWKPWFVISWWIRCHTCKSFCFILVNLILQDPVLYISFPLLWSLLDFFAANTDAEAEYNDAGKPALHHILIFIIYYIMSTMKEPLVFFYIAIVFFLYLNIQNILH